MAEGQGGEREEGGVRLTDGEIAAIRSSAHEAFGPSAVVRLFGSRIDDSRRGGDIDLHVQVAESIPAEARARFRRLLDRHVGEREYDVIISTTETPVSAIDRKALAEGIVL